MSVHRVAFFTNSLSREGGGLFHSVRSLAKYVRNSGRDINVFAPSDAYLDQDRVLWGDIRTFAYPPLLAYRARSKLFQYPPDIIHLNGLWLPHSQIVHSFSESQGIPRIISPRGMLDAWALHNARLKKMITGWMFEYRNLRGASCIHGLSESEYRAVRALGLEQPVAIIPNGVELPPSPANRQTLLWPYPEAWRGEPVLLFLSRIHPKKGLIPLLNAWQQIAQTGTHWRLAIVGPDEDNHVKNILSLIEDCDLQSSVAWIGPKYGQEKEACFHHASAFILPSFSEGFPMAVLEALSFSLPVILTPDCHLQEAVDAGAAFLTEPTNHGIAETLKNLFGLEHSQLAAMGQKGSELVTTSFTWDSIAKRMLAVYEWLVAPHHCVMPTDIRVD